MSVVVFVDHADGNIKKSSLEAAVYASKIASQRGGSVTAVALGPVSEEQLASLGSYGVTKVLHAADERFAAFDSKAFTKAIAEAANQENANAVVLSFNQNGKALGPRLSVRMQAGLIPGTIDLPDAEMNFKKSVFSGKAVAQYKANTDKVVISVNPNSIPVVKSEGSATVEPFSPAVADSDFNVSVKSVEKLTGKVPLTEAELVVSAGRGLKGPENWGMIEELAELLGAATACSRAVSDVDWRPHHEHVGQTGITIRPNLYFAVAISGAIQHLAGVNNSKVIVVVNIDPEAPFFKAADYGIVGDAFEVIPKINEAYRKFKEVNN